MENLTGRNGAASRRSASTSSDILVGSAAPLAEVKGRIFIVRLGREALKTILDGDNEPNERGTYSRAYTLRHPNTQWVHRGQGRYLPANDIKREAALIPQRRSRHSRPQLDATDETIVKTEAPEDDDEEFLLQESIRTAVSKHVPLARSQENEEKVQNRLQAINAKRNALTAPAPAPALPQRPFPPRWIEEMVYQRVMEQFDKPKKIRTTTRTDLSTGLDGRPTQPKPISVDPAIQRIPEREEISAARLDKFRSYVSQLILVESDAGSTIATFDDEPLSPLERPARKRRAIVDTLSDSLSQPPTYGLRHRLSEPQTPSAMEERAARLARRAKPIPSIERASRVTLRSQYSAASEDISIDSEDDIDSMGEDGDKTPTYPRQYVERHGPENFYHTGNGWYKKGPRPQPKVKDHNPDSLALSGERDGSFSFDGDKRKSIHKDELEKYPGVEFHHCGNGYYRPGPDPAGKRTSITVPYADGEEDDEDEEGAVGGTVSKEYKEAHPEVDWVHRGNGRYMRKADVIQDSAPAVSETSAAASVAGRRKSEPTFDKAYVNAHPKEVFYHTGNARYKRGSKPNGKPSIPIEESEDDDLTMLYDKAHVQAHPHQIFHHRGQGRWARGPKPTATPARDNDDVEDEDGDDDMEPTTLVDTSYVDSHPEMTFYHKGQGRWARGLPPPGSHNKVAVRGPGAKERLAARGSEEEEEDEAEKAPGLTALVTRGDGPDKFPGLTWHYRGGGKWGRVTKQEWTQMTANDTTDHKVTTFSKFTGKKRSTKASDGPDAQLAREAAAAAHGDEEGHYLNDDPDNDAAPLPEKPKSKRGRKSHRGNHQAHDELAGSKDTSKPQSKAATPPKRRMLGPDEDIITEEELPLSVFGNWRDIDPTADTDVAKAYRKMFLPIEIDTMANILNRHEPEVRSMYTLNRIAARCSYMIEQLQDEYIKLDQVVAPHAKVPRKPAKGGRVPVDPATFEDRKEAELYDYIYDPRKIGYQDPEAQRIVRDAEGRELRKRRNRSGIEPTDTVPGWRFGEGADLASKRQSRQPNRFDAVIERPRKRARTALEDSNAESMTPDRVGTPLLGPGGYRVQTAGRPSGHIPKRVRELRDNSVVSARTPNDGGSEVGGKVRKGRPPGSKNLHKRSDAGIKKGPRKPKVAPSVETSPAAVNWEGGDSASELAAETVARTEKGGLGERPDGEEEVAGSVA